MELLRGDGAIVCVGHRGAARLAAENSLEAIEAAAAHGADLVELDVVRGRDGGLVLAHGPVVPDDAPSLDGGLALVAHLGLGVQVDVKLDGLAQGVVESLRRHDLVDRGFVSSFSASILRSFRAVERAFPRSLTYPEDRHGISQSRVLGSALRPTLALLRAALPLRLPRLLGAVDAAAATLNAAVVSPRAVAACHRLGVAVYVWTVNDPELAAVLAENGADGIITDDPRVIVRGTNPR
jgi:glycerophosphoryl diester phosphodiesterase